MLPFVWWMISGLVLVVGLILSALQLARRWEQQQIRVAIATFRFRREVLEAKFLDLARKLGKPRGLYWRDCDWLDSTTFARDRQTGMITAFVGVNIHFEAIEGGDMEGVEAVSTVRDAAALFHYQNGAWGTGGKALFNMNPQDAVTRLAAQYDPLPA